MAMLLSGQTVSLAIHVSSVLMCRFSCSDRGQTNFFSWGNGLYNPLLLTESSFISFEWKKNPPISICCITGLFGVTCLYVYFIVVRLTEFQLELSICKRETMSQTNIEYVVSVFSDHQWGNLYLRVWLGWCARRTQGFILDRTEHPTSSSLLLVLSVLGLQYVL